MEIEIGEYVRTKDGKIGVFQGHNHNAKSNWTHKIKFQKIETIKYCCEEFIISHSKNIIDLIQEGDYVNGEKVDGFEITEGVVLTQTNGCFKEVDIKTILTKEQYEANCYVVKE